MSVRSGTAGRARPARAHHVDQLGAKAYWAGAAADAGVRDPLHPRRGVPRARAGARPVPAGVRDRPAGAHRDPDHAGLHAAHRALRLAAGSAVGERASRVRPRPRAVRPARRTWTPRRQAGPVADASVVAYNQAVGSWRAGFWSPPGGCPTSAWSAGAARAASVQETTRALSAPELARHRTRAPRTVVRRYRTQRLPLRPATPKPSISEACPRRGPAVCGLSGGLPGADRPPRRWPYRRPAGAYYARGIFPGCAGFSSLQRGKVVTTGIFQENLR